MAKLQVKAYILKNKTAREIHKNTDPEKALFLFKSCFFPETDLYSDIEIRGIKVIWTKNHAILDFLDLAIAQG